MPVTSAFHFERSRDGPEKSSKKTTFPLGAGGAGAAAGEPPGGAAATGGAGMRLACMNVAQMHSPINPNNQVLPFLCISDIVSLVIIEEHLCSCLIIGQTHLTKRHCP